MQIAMPCTRLAPREDIMNHVPGKELSFREQKSLFTIDGSLYVLAPEDERCVPIVMVRFTVTNRQFKTPLTSGDHYHPILFSQHANATLNPTESRYFSS